MTPKQMMSGRHQVNGSSRQPGEVHAGAARREPRPPNRRPYSSPVLVDRKRNLGRRVWATITGVERERPNVLAEQAAGSVDRGEGFRVRGSGFGVQIVVDNDWDNDCDKDGRSTTIRTMTRTMIGTRIMITISTTMIGTTIGTMIMTTMGERLTITSAD
jgi:hypothetical protein